MAPIQLGYWKIRGLAQPVRMLLGYNKQEFEDVLYECGDAPDYDQSVWIKAKPTLGLDFPNLPYLIDGDVKVTQSNAVLRYLSRKFDMEPTTDEGVVRLAMIENQAMDFRNGFVALVYRTSSDDFVAKAKQYAEKIRNLLSMFDKFLANESFFAKERLTFVDFVMYELLDQHRLFSDFLMKEGSISRGILDGFDNLNRFMKEFEAIPEIKEFMASEKCFKGDVNLKMAHFK